MRNLQHPAAFTASAILAAGLSACAGGIPLHAPPAEVTGIGNEIEQATPTEKASLTLTIRWPDRTVAAIPVEAVRIDAVVKDSSGNTLGQGSVNRDGAPTSMLTIADLTVPVTGNVTVNVQAFDANNTEVGIGTATAKLVPNQKIALRLTMQETKVPAITLINPPAAGAGAYIKVTGVNLPTSKDGLSVSIGGIPVSSALLQVSQSGTSLEFPVPEGATSDSVILTYGPRTVRSGDMFQTVTALELTQTGGTLAKNGTASFQVVAKGSNGSALSGVNLFWNMTNVQAATAGGSGGGAAGGQGPSGLPTAGSIGNFEPFLTTTTVTGSVAGGQGGGGGGGGSSTPVATSSIAFTDAGTGTIEVKTGNVVATATIVVSP
ncbi:MAG: IPT/TIG domain-containing protein [Candidatus Sericytochromatia bacterium]|nr:IPT/TIG domain-containing protein [Candidatus Sericytochromatia bacterium]